MRFIPILTVATLLAFICLALLPSIMPQGAVESGWDPKQVRLIGSVVVSVVLGVAALAIIFFKQDEADRKWAYGMVGTIAGYWLPSPVQ